MAPRPRCCAQDVAQKGFLQMFGHQPTIPVLTALVIIAITAGSLVGVGSQAVFTDTATSSSNAFTSGTVDLKLDNGGAASDSVTQTFLVSNMVPGDSVTRPTLPDRAR